MISARLAVLFSVALGCCLAQDVNPVTAPVEHAEGPHWDNRNNALYFVDIAGNSVLRYDQNSGNTATIQLPTTEGVTLVIPRRGDRLDQFVVTLGRSIQILTWDGSDGSEPILYPVASVEPDKPGNRFNDGKADLTGRLWAGTMGAEPVVGQVEPDNAALYSLEPNSTEPKTQVAPVTISNGLAWTRDNTIMYYIDTPTRNVTAFDFDITTGTLANGRTAFSFDENNVQGNPDGMTIDEEGNLWIACFGGWQVIRVNPNTGELLQQVALPVERVTSLAWGGSNLDILYVTTSRHGLTDEQLQQQPLAGSVFKVEGLGVFGTGAYTAARVL